MDDEPEVREEGFYWVALGQNPPEVAYWERAEWWLCGEGRPVAARGGDGREGTARVQAPAVSGGLMLRWGQIDDWPSAVPGSLGSAVSLSPQHTPRSRAQSGPMPQL
jgi:hypothetical protein